MGFYMYFNLFMAKRKNSKSSRKSTVSGTGRSLMLIPLIVIAALVWLYARGQFNLPSANKLLAAAEGDYEYVKTSPNVQEELVKYSGMSISFNRDLHIPNWVAWELTRGETAGTEPRANNFVRDYNVAGCADPSDYRHSGYDRGHMVPAGDMKWSEQAMTESFMMTNICPQAKALNTGAWKKLEEKCRFWAERDSALVIVCGPVLNDGFDKYLGESQVAVPKRYFKVILAPYANPPRGIGFIMPNARVEGGMQRAAVSIDEVERITGHDFFSALPDEIENEVESECRFNYWSRLK